METSTPTGSNQQNGAQTGQPSRGRDGADQKRVLADQVELLYRQSIQGILGTIFIGAIATFELWSQQYRELVIFWWILTLFICALRYLLWHAWKKRTDQDHDKWLRWFAIAALATGANWGFAGSVFFPSHADEQQVFLAFLLAGMSSGGIPFFSAVWWVYALYAAGIMLPFTYVLATFGNRLFAELALLVPLFFAANVAVSLRLSQVFASGFRLRQAYGRLTEDYSAINRRLEQQLVELEEARRQVEASGRKLTLFSERSPIAVFEFDPEGKVLSMNPAAEHLFGYAAPEMVGRPGTSFLFPEALVPDVAQRWREFIKATKPEIGLRYANVRRDGTEIICEWSLTPLVNPDNLVISVILQGQDITQQLESERLKKEFTSTLSHELRTPLTSIIGSLQLVNTGVLGDIAPDVTELTSIAERNAQRLLDLINDLLDIDKIESGKFTLYPEVIPLDELVQESLLLNKAFAERFHVRLEADSSLRPVQATADRKRALQVMTNLLSNASKFSPENGVVEVSMETRGSMVRICVHDRGPGIPESFRGRIFSRFAQADMTATRQKGGTGLGLAICKRLVELMDGELGFDDRAGGGSTFWFELPVQE
jgi:PAS domain S-box-containing protein